MRVSDASLNLVRAAKAPTPESSEYTSAHERITLRNQRKEADDHWLTPIQDTTKRRGYLSLSLEEYLIVLDTTGRIVKKSKRGSIPLELEPILVRVGIKPEGWIPAVQKLGNSFSFAVANPDTMGRIAKPPGRLWLKGVSMARRVFA